MNFTHLHVHTEYSLLDGMCKIDDLLKTAIEMGMTSIAITDHGAMYGAFQFYIKARDLGIKPIIGVEIYKAKGSRHDKNGVQDKEQYHLTLLAKNHEGYKNLMRMVTIANLEGFYYRPRIDFEVLEKYSEGVIALSGCLNGEIASLIGENEDKEAERVLQKYLKIFKDDFYLELQRHPDIEDQDRINNELVKLSRKFVVPIVATNDVHYIKKEDAYAQEILLCIQTQHTILEEDRPVSMIDIPDFYLKTPEEMKSEFQDLPEAIENTNKISDKCNLEIPYGKLILPVYPTKENKSPDQILKDLVYERLNEKYAKKIWTTDQDEKIKTRIEFELEVIKNKGYSTYFLIVQDFVNWAKNNGIAVGPGRGSAAGSIVSFILRITDVDPLLYNLPFERFLNPERPTPPDIDIDFSDRHRDEVLAYVSKKYGEDKVAQIITFGRMEARMAVRDVARALGQSYAQGDRIAKMIPQGKQGFPVTIDIALNESPTLKHAYSTEEDVKRVIDVSKKVEGLARHSSVHAAGVVIGDKSLTEYVPLQKEAKGDRIITQYDMYNLDINAVSDAKAVGLLKMDFLGLRNLSILEDAIRFVEETNQKKVDIHTVPLDDKKTFELISAGNTIGVFQLESLGMRHLAKDLEPTKITDITAMVALYRPGPMDLIPNFVEGKKNPKKIRYLHPDLKEVFEETYGVMVYQEQVMDIAVKMAGFSKSEADILRMAVGKKKKALMKKEKEKFLAGCVKKGYKESLAEKIFGFIEKFASYGFNKSHSACYGLIAYWTAYMKANYPVEYMTALLSAELTGVAGSQREIKMIQAIDECKKMEIKVLQPDINKSFQDFKIENGAIRFGLSAIKNVGSVAIDSIVNARKNGEFVCFKDFLNRVDLSKVNKKTIESLIKAGGFDNFGDRAALLLFYPKALEDINRSKAELSKGQFNLFADHSEKHTSDDLPDFVKCTDNEALNMEKEVIGFSITKNPLEQYKDIIESKVTKKLGEVTQDDIGKTLVLAGNISRIKKVNTKKTNQQMAFVTIFDEIGSIELIVFPKLFAQTKDLWSPNTIVLLKGKIDEKEDRLNMIVDQAIDIATYQI